MGKIEKFIEIYKALENAIILEGTYSSVYEYEQSLPEKESKKMQLCRLCRNYIQHEQDIFIEPSIAMISFIDYCKTQILFMRKQAKEIMKRVKPISVSEKPKDLAGKLLTAKNGLIIVDKDNNVLGIFDARSLAIAVNKNALSKKIDVSTLSLDYKTATPDSAAEDISSFTVITDNGEKHGKYKGVCIPV